jgi:septum formation protein
MSEKFKPSFILASASPRRRDLLTKAGYDFKIIISNIDESVFDEEKISPAEHAKKLALAKARDVAKKYPDKIIVGADTVADFDNEIIGKAQTKNHAEQITRKLFSKPHKVITAIAILWKANNIELVKADTTIVYPKRLNAEQINSHIKSGRWKDKAGAYAIQENGDEFVERIEGSLTNVMGLGMELFTEMFNQLNEKL